MKWEINALPALHALTPWCKTVKIRMLVGDSAPGNIWGPVNGGTEGPELGVEAPRGWRRQGGAVWGGAIALPGMRVWGLCRQKILQQSTLKSRIFRNFCELKWSLL